MDLYSKLYHNRTRELCRIVNHSSNIGTCGIPTKKLSKDHLSFCREPATSAACLSALSMRMTIRRRLICWRLSATSSIELYIACQHNRQNKAKKIDLDKVCTRSRSAGG